jgi:hypothetical protein
MKKDEVSELLIKITGYYCLFLFIIFILVSCFGIQFGEQGTAVLAILWLLFPPIALSVLIISRFWIRHFGWIFFITLLLCIFLLLLELFFMAGIGDGIMSMG